MKNNYFKDLLNYEMIRIESLMTVQKNHTYDHHRYCYANTRHQGTLLARQHKVAPWWQYIALRLTTIL